MAIYHLTFLTNENNLAPWLILVGYITVLNTIYCKFNLIAFWLGQFMSLLTTKFIQILVCDVHPMFASDFLRFQLTWINKYNKSSHMSSVN
ncbi:hypothetical protein GLYMA_18G171200v4 [Glycine max]|uniref:Uncharacterized protein n=1 Tax=Glycine max TaxID=3847 RepID=K7MSV6_SOYBN|nr:hypothetical protein GYH30_050235 [Glycine max]KRG99793.1 hypothetical protein GLYMA_18G171200v4 [Glycine max]